MRFLILLVAFIFPSFCSAATSSGRISLGGYSAVEKFKTPVSGTDRNDVALGSARFFLNISEMGSNRFEAVADVRDTHDFFDKVDRERLELSSENQLQLRQLFIRGKETPSQYFFSAGRFAIGEAGGVFADGAELGFRLNREWRFALFGGLNPEVAGEEALQFEGSRQRFGGYSLFESAEKNLYFTNALNGERADSSLTRFFWFSEATLGFEDRSRLHYFTYLDFKPRVAIERAFVTYERELLERLSGKAMFTLMDPTDYEHEEDILETLDPVRFYEGALQLKYRLHDIVWETRARYGQRSDDKSRTILQAGASIHDFWNESLGLQTFLGWRNNFTSKDLFWKGLVGFYRRDWQTEFSQDVARESEESGGVDWPTISELSGSVFVWKTLMATASIEYARDQNVDIYAGLLKLSYSFGAKARTPIPDRAPQGDKL